MMQFRPIAELPAELKNGRGLLLYGHHDDDSGREGSFKRGDRWWAIALWDVWWQRNPWASSGPRWVFALNGHPLEWGEPTHFCELEPPR